MVTLVEQVSQQRKQIEDTRKKLQEQREKSKLRSQRELRQADRSKRQQKSALTQRAERKSQRELLGKGIAQVGEFEESFEGEIAEKAPRLGKQEYVQKQYEKSIAKIDEKIGREQARIDNYNKRIASFSDDGVVTSSESDKIEEIEDDISVVRSRIKGYSRAKGGSQADVIENVTYGIDENLANNAENRRMRTLQYNADVRSGKYDETFKTLGLDKRASISEFNRAVDKFNRQLKMQISEEKMTGVTPELSKSEYIYKQQPVRTIKNIRTGELSSYVAAGSIPKGFQEINKFSKIDRTPRQELLSNLKKIDTKDIKIEVPDRKGQTYLSSVGGFVDRKDIYSGKGGTLEVQGVPTPIEVERMKEIKSPVGRFIFGTDKRDENLLTADIGGLSADKREIEKIQENIDRLETANVKDNVWEGSEASYKEYEKNIERLKDLGASLDSQGNIRQPTISAGLFGLTKEIEKTKAPAGFSAIDTAKAASTSFFSTFETGGRKVGESLVTEEGYLISPEKNITVKTVEQGTAQFDPLTGKPIVFKETPLTVPERRITKEGAGEVGATLGFLAGFAVPGATALYVAGEAPYLAREGIKAPDKIKFLKESKEEVIALGAIGSFKALQIGRGLTKAGATRKFVSKETLMTRVERGGPRPVKNVLESDIERLRLERVNNFGKVKSVKKGKVTETEYFQSTDIPYVVKEVRDIGKVRFEKVEGGLFGWGKIKIGRAERELSGIGVQTEKGIVEVVNLGKGKQRVITTDLSGKGTFKIIDKEGGIISQGKISKSEMVQFGKPKVSTEKIRVDKQTVQKGQTLKVEEKIVGGKKVKRVVNEFGEEVVDEFGKPVTTLKEAKRVVGKIDIETKSFQNLEKGFAFSQTTGTGFTDITKSGAFKGKLDVVAGGKKATLKSQRVPRIEYGIDKSVDAVSTIKTPQGTISVRSITPKTSRKFTQLEGSEYLSVYVNPKYSKNIRKLQKEQRAFEKEAMKTWKEGDEVGKIIDDNIATQNAIELENIAKAGQTSKVVQSTDDAFIQGQKAARKRMGLEVDEKEILEIGGITKVASPETLLKETGKKAEPVLKSFDDVKTDINLNLGVRGKSPAALKETEKIETEQIQPQKKIEKVFVSTDSRSILKTQQPTKQKDFISQIDLTTQQPKVRERLRIKVRQLQLQKQAQKLQSRQTTTSTPTTPKRSIIKKPIIKIFPKLETELKSTRSRTKGEDSSFKVFTRKFGKDIEVGAFKTKQEAKKKLIKELKGTLRASGFIEEEGVKLKVSELGILSPEFRKGKKEGFRLVQKRSRRLGGRGETSEAQFFRKSKKKGGIL